MSVAGVCIQNRALSTEGVRSSTSTAGAVVAVGVCTHNRALNTEHTIAFMTPKGEGECDRECKCECMYCCWVLQVLSRSAALRLQAGSIFDNTPDCKVQNEKNRSMTTAS